MLDYKKMTDNIAALLTAFLIASFIIFDVISGGRYLFLALSIIILLLKTKGKIEIEPEPYYVFNIMMIAFTGASSLWAWNASLSIEMFKRMIVTFVCFALVYLAYKDDQDTRIFLNCFKWAGYIVMLYTVQRYGINQLKTMLLNAVRMRGDFGNSNLFGMSMAFSCAFEFIEIAQKKRVTLSCPFVIPCILLIAATQSRKAFFIVLFSVFFVFLFYVLDLKRPLYSIVATLIFAGLVTLLFHYMQYSPLFSGLNNRVELFINYVIGEGDIGISVKERNQMIQIGWDQFLRTPILGIGIANAGLVTRQYNDVIFTYLHNNYIELLCGGGLIGFTIYYSRYIFLQAKLLFNIHNKEVDVIPCEIIIFLLLFLDYGRVSYYQKSNQIFFVLLFLQLKNIEKSSNSTKLIKNYQYLKS